MKTVSSHKIFFFLTRPISLLTLIFNVNIKIYSVNSKVRPCSVVLVVMLRWEIENCTKKFKFCGKKWGLTHWTRPRTEEISIWTAIVDKRDDRLRSNLERCLLRCVTFHSNRQIKDCFHGGLLYKHMPKLKSISILDDDSISHMQTWWLISIKLGNAVRHSCAYIREKRNWINLLKKTFKFEISGIFWTQ